MMSEKFLTCSNELHKTYEITYETETSLNMNLYSTTISFNSHQ